MARHMLSLFGLAPDGVYLAGSVAKSAVRSYRTLSSLPYDLQANHLGGFLSVALSLSSRWPGITRHPAFVEPGLSSNIATRDRPAL